MVETSFLDVAQTKYSQKDDVKYFKTLPKGLSEDIVRQISAIKKEPQWMLDFRLKALQIFRDKPMPTWGADLSDIDFDSITYYMSPTEKSTENWDDVPPEIRKTFDRLGIPEAEKKFLAGAGAMYESETVYHKLREDLAAKGVIFCDTDTALKEHPELVKKYLGTVIPIGDNKFASLNSAVWSGGSFVYVPKNVHIDMPLQAYFRINSANVGQFERTIIIADEGASVHYIEGCFTKGTTIHTNPDFKPIEEIKVGDRVLTHTGEYKKVYHTQVRPYTGELYKVSAHGNPNEIIEVTEEHPVLTVRRKYPRERNKKWKVEWIKAKDLKKLDYIVTPKNKVVNSQEFIEMEIADKRKGKTPKMTVRIPSTKDFFRLAGYYLAEGSISNGYYLNFSFGSHEKEYIKDVKTLLKRVFGVKKTYDPEHKINHGISVVVSSVKLARIFESLFGKGSSNKKIPYWMILETPEKQKELILGLFRGDGNYYNKNTKANGWLKEIFRINTTSQKLARQTKDILLRLDIAAFLNSRDRSKDNRKTMYTIGITGEYMKKFGDLVGIKIREKIYGKKRATMFYIDKDYMYSPIKNINKKYVKNLDVYNFSVEDNESYIANNVAVHNCSAPKYSSNSLHSAVVEVIAHKNSRVRYTTLQNWSGNIYNLVTKRAFAHEGSYVEWLDANIGAKVTMKYPGVYLLGEHARANILSVAFANAGQHQDAGAKAVHLAPNTSSTIISKSVSKNGGITTYRGLLKVAPGAKNVKAHVRCDALILDDKSKSDTIPYMEIGEKKVSVGHEATVGKISDEKLFYLMSRGMTEQQAMTMVVSGFLQEFVKELPLEYAIEFNRLIELEMEGAVG